MTGGILNHDPDGWGCHDHALAPKDSLPHRRKMGKASKPPTWSLFKDASPWYACAHSPLADEITLLGDLLHRTEDVHFGRDFLRAFRREPRGLRLALLRSLGPLVHAAPRTIRVFADPDPDDRSFLRYAIEIEEPNLDLDRLFETTEKYSEILRSELEEKDLDEHRGRLYVSVVPSHAQR